MATVKVLDPGRPPRRKLRYAWRVGQHEDLTMDLHTAASTEAAGMKQPEVQLPTMRIVIGIDPLRVAPDTEALTYAWHVTSAGIADDDAGASPYASGMTAEMDTITHLSGTAVVTSRGLAQEIAIDPASMQEKDAGAGYMVEQVRQTLRDLAAALPEEDVGRGARWQKLSQILSKDESITQTDTITLSELAGDKGALDDVLAQTAPPQPLRMPGATARTKMESMLTSGDATTRFDLTRVVPQTKFDGTTTMVVSEDRSQRLTMIMRLGIVLQGAVARGAAH